MKRPLDRFDEEDRAVRWVGCIIWGGVLTTVVLLLIVLLNVVERLASTFVSSR